MLDFTSLIKTSWKKTDGQKALFWKGYGFVLLFLVCIVYLPIAVLVTYFHYFTGPTLPNTTLTVFLVVALIVIAVIGVFYTIILFSTLPYFALRFLKQEEPFNFSAIARKALVHKWAIFANWFCMGFTFGIIHKLLETLTGCYTCVALQLAVFTLLHLMVSIATLEILDKNKPTFIAFANTWKLLFNNFISFILTSVWLCLLTLFSFVTLFIGAIWAVPAQYNAIALLFTDLNKGESTC
jgi:hypothetical protein